MKQDLDFLSKSALIFAVVAFFGIQNYGFTQDKADRIDELMKRYSELGQFSGSVLVSEGGRIVYKKGFALANIEWNIPNEPDTKFRIASVTKQFTAMLIMKLVEDRKLSLDAKISDYLPYYRKDIGEKVTVHHLLTHTSGIPDYLRIPEFFSDLCFYSYTVDEFIKKHCSGDLEFEPGSRFAYSNSGYYILGAIIKKIAGKTYEEVLRKMILDPLNMKNTGYDHNETVLPKRANGYYKTADGYENKSYYDMSIWYSAAGMYSTAEDLYLWDQALYTEKLISKKYKELMFKPHIRAEPAYFKGNYVYGWFVRKINITESKDGLTALSHGGHIGGFDASLTRLVDDKHLIILLTNVFRPHTDRTRLGEITRGLINVLYDKPYEMYKKIVSEVQTSLN